MAKESFVLFKSFYEPTKMLTREQKGELYDAIFLYQIDGVEPNNTSEIYMAFMFFKNQFRLDEAKWEQIVERRREAGSLGGKQKVANVANATDAKQSKQTVANVAVNENVNDTVTVNEDKPISPNAKIDHESFARNLFADTAEAKEQRDSIEMSCRVKPTIEYARKFNATLITDSKRHDKENEWRKHFRNWLTKGGHKVGFEEQSKTGATEFNFQHIPKKK